MFLALWLFAPSLCRCLHAKVAKGGVTQGGENEVCLCLKQLQHTVGHASANALSSGLRAGAAAGWMHIILCHRCRDLGARSCSKSQRMSLLLVSSLTGPHSAPPEPLWTTVTHLCLPHSTVTCGWSEATTCQLSSAGSAFGLSHSESSEPQPQAGSIPSRCLVCPAA